jgi:hypothetical protein
VGPAFFLGDSAATAAFFPFFGGAVFTFRGVFFVFRVDDFVLTVLVLLTIFLVLVLLILAIKTPQLGLNRLAEPVTNSQEKAFEKGICKDGSLPAN